jgi:hypothetical protein
MAKRINFNQMIKPASSTNVMSVWTESQMVENAKAQAEADSTKLEFDAWAAATLVKNAEAPFLPGVKFGDLLVMETHEKGWPMAVLNKGGKKGIKFATNTSAAINAVMDSLVTRRYGRDLKVGRHERVFNRADPLEKNVLSVFQGNEWVRFDWQVGHYRLSTPFEDSKQYKYWSQKHDQIDLLLACLDGGYEFHLTFFNEWQINRFKHAVLDRMDGTIADALKGRVEDWEVAKAAQYINEQAKKDDKLTLTSVVVDNLDLVKASVDIFVTISTPFSPAYNKLVRCQNENDLKTVASVVKHVAAGDQGYSISLKK